MFQRCNRRGWLFGSDEALSFDLAITGGCRSGISTKRGVVK